MLNLNKFFEIIKIKKIIINKIINKVKYLNNRENKEFRLQNLPLIQINRQVIKFIKYILTISFSKKNTLLQFINYSGKFEFCYSAGNFNFKGKKKLARKIVLKEMLKDLISKITYLRKHPIALHLKNTTNNCFWVIRVVKKLFFINIVQVYNSYPFNGCRKKKVRRKKFRTNKKKSVLKFRSSETANSLLKFNKTKPIKSLLPLPVSVLVDPLFVSNQKKSH